MAPRRIVHPQQVARRDGAGVVHQDIELARLGRDAAHRRIRRQIGRDRAHVHLPARADRGRSLVQRALVARDQRDVAALVRQQLGRGTADALRAAGDQRLLAGELQVHLMPPFAVPTDTPRTPRRTRGTSPGWRCRRRSPIPGATARRTRTPARAPTRTASIVPSGARASTTSPGASVSIAWPCSEFTRIFVLPTMRASWPDRNTRCRGAYFSSSVPGPGAMVHPLGDLVHLLVQRAAERHVQLLDAAADRQHRHAARERLGDQPQRGGVAFQVVVLGREAVAAVVVRGMHVARAAGQQQTVEPIEHGQRCLAHRRDQDRHRAGAAQHGRGIARRRIVAQLAVHDQSGAGRDADDRVHEAVISWQGWRAFQPQLRGERKWANDDRHR